MKVFKILTVLVLALFSACSYIEDADSVATDFDVTFEGLKGTQTHVIIAPANNNVYYTFNLFLKKEYEDYCAEFGGKEAFFKESLAELESKYDMLCKYYRDELHQEYIAQFRHMILSRGKSNLFFTQLTPDSDYVLAGACVDPDTKKQIGTILEYPFHTTLISDEVSSTQLLFMIDDAGNDFYYYTKPMIGDRVSNEQYLTDIVPEEVLNAEPYNGNLAQYADMRFMQISLFNQLDEMIKKDITLECVSNMRSKENEGKKFIIYGAPFNIHNKDIPNSLTFTYTRGMKMIGYTNDQQQ